MSELAFNANGENFEIPATVTGWRVRRMKPRGAPELVYGRDGGPLVVGVEADIEELRDAVGIAGKYRLDPINDDGRCVENVPAAYVQVVKSDRSATTPPATAPASSDDTLREAMRLNTELARSVIDRFPEMVQAAAELLRAADGAGLPARKPYDVGEETGEDDATTDSSPAFELINALVAQVVPVVVSSLTSKGMPKLGAVLDWRKAVPESKQLEASAPAKPVDRRAVLEAKAKVEPPPLDPKAMSHFIEIQSALTPVESRLAREVAATLSATEMRAWLTELSAMSVSDAVAKIRSFIGETLRKKGGAS